jgi:uncharacterized membrane protein
MVLGALLAVHLLAQRRLVAQAVAVTSTAELQARQEILHRLLHHKEITVATATALILMVAVEVAVPARLE